MDINTEGFMLMPRWLRNTVTAFVVFLLLISLIFSIYALININKENDIVFESAIELMQAAIIASGGWLFLYFSKSRISRNTVFRETDKFITVDVPEAINKISWFSDDKENIIYDMNCKDVIHQNNTTYGFYVIKSMRWGEIIVFIQVNVKVVEVIYYLECDDAGKNKKSFTASVTGASTTGWEYKEYGSMKFEDPIPKFKNNFFYAVMLKLKLDDMFLFSSTSRIFLANDIAMMTKSFVQEAGHDGLSCI